MSAMTETCDQLIPTKPRGVCGPITGGAIEEIVPNKHEKCKRKCGCTKTSEKLKQVMGKFPAPPPPTPMDVMMYDKACGYTYGRGETKPGMPSLPCPAMAAAYGSCCKDEETRKHSGASWKIVSELVTVVQLSVTATALALYYLIYCYMQVVYYTLKSAMYFHNADGPMKVTIGVVTATTLIIAFNLLMRMEAIIGIVY